LIHEPGNAERKAETSVEFVCVREADNLTVTGRFAVPVGDIPRDEALWRRPRIEVLLKPFPGCTAVAQFAVAENGAQGMLWHGCPVPDEFDWTGRAGGADADGCWTVELVVSLTAIEAWIRRSCGVADTVATEWRWLGGAALLPRPVTFAEWEKHVGEAGGMAADPRFVNAERLDFRLRPDSPALALGFIPFEYPGSTWVIKVFSSN
jgi:hypothetical protein